MIIYNLVGFGIGKDELWEILISLKTFDGVYYLTMNILALTDLVISLFYIKQFN